MGKLIIDGIEFKFNNIYKNGVETDEIESDMFYENKLLTYVEMDMITVINYQAFRRCSNLHTAIFKRLRVIGENAFSGCGFKTIDISNVVSIGEGCFRGCEIETISLNDEITEIPMEAFCECETLKTIKLPSNLEAVRYRAFYRCTKIEKMQIPTTIRVIESYAFYLSGAGEIILTEEVEIGTDAFWGCYFKKVVIKKITTIQKGMFARSSIIAAEFESVDKIERMGFEFCKKLTSIFMPKVREIEDFAFQYCENLTITSLPETLEKIGIASFAITKIAITKLPKKITTIPSSCFYGCLSLTNLSLGDKGYPVTFIHEIAFGNCENLTNLTIYTTGGQALAGAPWGATNATITYLPA